MTEDPAKILADLAAQAVDENWLALKAKPRAAVLDAMAGLLREFPTSQGETCWIVARGPAPDLPEWPSLPYARRKAVEAFAGVLPVMDRALRPEPKPKPALPAPRMPGKAALSAKKPGLAPIFKR